MGASMGKIRIETDWDDVEELAEDLIESGVSEETVAQAIGRFADRAIPMDAIFPGPVGMGLELVDDKVFTKAAEGLGEIGKAAVKAIGGLIRSNPEKRAKRKAERRKRRKNRKNRK
jgi:hypothetical protein